MYRNRIAAAAAVVAVTVGLAAAPALAEDCFNASRTAQGNVSSANAGTWWSIPEVLAELGGLNQAQIDQVMPVIQADSRIPANFTVFYNPAHPGELAQKMNPANAANGKGIDHSDDYTTPVFAAIFQDVAIALS